MFIGNIVNIVQHSHLYNSFLLIIVACIVILLVAIWYRDHVNNCLLQCMCIISKQILFYGSDVQLYNEKAFQNNIKSII
jgi:undecaprenyl pyrophosphate phosphatase UppP